MHKQLLERAGTAKFPREYLKNLAKLVIAMLHILRQLDHKDEKADANGIPQEREDMAKGYWIAHVDVDDMEQYKAYISANAAAFSEFGATFLVRGGIKEVREGHTRARTVLIEFKDFETAKACYDSVTYQDAKALRDPVATGDLEIVEGYAG